MTKEQAVFGGGCFWCTEAVFRMMNGVKEVLPGYAGGTEADAKYEKVASGKTDHAEVVSVEYDSDKVSYHDLLTIFFASHDPTTINRQGNDIGPQYRSIIFYTTDDQREEAEEFIKELNLTSREGEEVVTEVERLAKFYEAEEYHKDYYENNSSQPYCQVIINPKLRKVQEDFAELLKDM